MHILSLPRHASENSDIYIVPRWILVGLIVKHGTTAAPIFHQAREGAIT